MREEKQWISSENLFAAMEELLAGGRQAVFTVTGMSMWPFLCHGRDQAVIEACAPESLKRGDIILFRTAIGNYVLHRITGITAEKFQTAGDGNCHYDGWFPRSCVRARAVKLIRNGKEIDCGSAVWKQIFRIWMALFPVRGILLKIMRTGWKAVSERKKRL